MPNPFNPQVTLRFAVPRQTDLATLETLRRGGPPRAARCRRRRWRPGAHEFTWNGTDDGGRRVSSGTYLARLRAGGEQVVHRVVMVE